MINVRHFDDVDPANWRWPNFSPREMASKSDGELKLNIHAMDRLQSLRDALGVPLIVVSAYRSPAHNRRVGGAKRSEHMNGTAFDISMWNHNPHEFEAAARKAGFTGFGFYPDNNFMHIDIGTAREWGNRWPKTETGLPIEPKRRPESMPKDPETQGLAVGGAGTFAIAAMQTAPGFTDSLGDLAPIAQTVAIAAIAAGIGYAAWKRWR